MHIYERVYDEREVMLLVIYVLYTYINVSVCVHVNTVVLCFFLYILKYLIKFNEYLLFVIKLSNLYFLLDHTLRVSFALIGGYRRVTVIVILVTVS